MNRLLVISEKYGQSLAICNSLFEHGVINKDTLIDLIHVMPMSWWHFKIPNRISMSSIPFAERPQFLDLSPNPAVVDVDNLSPVKPGLLYRFDCLCFPGEGFIQLREQAKHLNSAHPSLPGRKGPIQTVADRIDQYDQIIVAPDSDHSGWASAYRWIYMLEEHIKQKDTTNSFFSEKREVRGLWMHRGMDSESLHLSYSENTPLNDKRIQRARNIGDAKRVFDYWWFYNSAAIFTKLLRDVGVEKPRILSKYELMTLHLLSRWGEPISGQNLIGSMESWLGTGKYEPAHFFGPRKREGFHAQCYRSDAISQHPMNGVDMIWGQIGSAMSRVQILKNLAAMDLINGGIDWNDKISLSEKGLKFLSRCHKSTFDPDLPFRLAVWCENQEYDKMARYIRTVFGKQKRYLSKLSSQGN